MNEYKKILKEVLTDGVIREDRTGTGTKSLFGKSMRFDLSKGFPLVTTKKMFTKGMTYELLWILKGDTNIKYLNDNGVYFWDEWSDEEGNLNKIYGHQWRSWNDYNGNTIDQISNVINSIKTNPYSRRHIVSCWNVSQIDEMALPPCHTLFQFYVANNKLSCQLYQRSADLFLGIPVNIASYSLLTSMIAQVCNLEVGDFIHTIGDAHIYLNHINQVEEQLTRDCLDLPYLELNEDIKNIFDFKYEDIKIKNYRSHGIIKGEISV